MRVTDKYLGRIISVWSNPVRREPYNIINVGIPNDAVERLVVDRLIYASVSYFLFVYNIIRCRLIIN